MKHLIVLVLLISSSAFAGTQGSGGGKGVVCRDSRGRVKSVELLDLWEAREAFRYTIKNSNASVAKQVADGIEALKYATQIWADGKFGEGDKDYTEPEYIAHWLDQITTLFLTGDKKYIYQTTGIALTPTDDSFEVASPDPHGPCKIEQLVNYIDSPLFPHILVNQDLVKRMSKTHQAALYLHEAFYVFLRGYSPLSVFDQNRDQDSVRVRRSIGWAFSGHKFLSLNSLLPKTYMLCTAENPAAPTMPTTFYLYEDAEGNSHEITTQLYGKRMIGFVPENRSSIVLSELLKSEVCANPGPPNYNSQGPGVYNIYGSGPVEFQLQVWLGGDCDHGKSVMMIEPDHFSGPFNQNAQVIHCSMVDPGAPAAPRK